MWRSIKMGKRKELEKVKLALKLRGAEKNDEKRWFKPKGKRMEIVHR
jgi:hypothetical protein